MSDETDNGCHAPFLPTDSNPFPPSRATSPSAPCFRKSTADFSWWRLCIPAGIAAKEKMDNGKTSGFCSATWGQAFDIQVVCNEHDVPDSGSTLEPDHTYRSVDRDKGHSSNQSHHSSEHVRNDKIQGWLGVIIMGNLSCTRSISLTRHSLMSAPIGGISQYSRGRRYILQTSHLSPRRNVIDLSRLRVPMNTWQVTKPQTTTTTDHNHPTKIWHKNKTRIKDARRNAAPPPPHT